MRQYLYISQLAEVSPWSAAAIRKMMSRGVLRQGEHYFKPGGRNARPIFSWAAIERFIEGRDESESCAGSKGKISMANGVVVDVDG